MTPTRNDYVTRTEPPAFTSRVSPGAVWVDGRRVEYALGRPTAGCAIVYVIDVFPIGDERARLVLLIDGAAGDVDDLVMANVYRHVAAAMRGCEPEAVVVPDRIGSWLLGMTEADIAAYNAEVRKLIGEPRDSKVASIEEYRRARRAS